VDKVGGDELGEEGGDHVREEDDAFGDLGADEVEGGGKDDYVEDIVDKTCIGD